MFKTWRIIFILLVLSARISSVAAQTADRPEKLSPGELTSLLQGGEDTLFYGGVMVSAGDTLVGPVVVIAGALDIQDGGILAGDAWIINGRLILNGTARVLGRVKLVNGREFLSRRAEVTGGIVYYTCACRLDNGLFEDDKKLVFIKEEDPRAIKTKLALSSGGGNRVDYGAVYFGLKRQNPRHKKPHLRGHALLHFPFRNNTRGYLGFDLDFAIPLRGKQVDLLVRGFKKTSTNDFWQLSRAENEWMLSLTGSDYGDYYERQGGELGLRSQLTRNLQLVTYLSLQRELSLITKPSPSLFYPNRRLRANPAIDEGKRLAAGATLTFDTRSDVNYPGDAWMFLGEIEKGIADGPGDFSYTMFSAELRRYNQLLPGLRFDLRSKIHTAYDPLPAQVSQSLNGYSGVRGLSNLPFTVFRGDRLALLSGEVRVALPELPVFRWLFSRWDLLCFSDVGLLMAAEHKQAPLAFLDTPWSAWRKSVGIGISGESFLPYVGIYVAQDLDRHRRQPRIIVRINRSF